MGSPANVISVVVADDHPLILEGVRALLGPASDIDVVGEAADGQSAVEIVLERRPAVAVLDVRMPVLDGIEATRRIVRECPGTRVVLLTATADPSLAIDALRAGAVGYLPKEAFADALIGAIRSAAAGELALTPDMMASVVREVQAPSASNRLTEADRRLLEMVAQGWTNTQIARALSVSASTVKGQLSSLFKRLGARDRASALAICFRRGWLT